MAAMSGGRRDWFHELRALLCDPVVVAALLGLLGVLVHLPALEGDFVFDDTPAIVENPIVTGDVEWTEAFRRNFWADRPGYEAIVTWRPLTTLGFRAQWTLAGAAPVYFHAVNLLLHGLVIALLYALIREWLRSPSAAAFGAALFAVLPVHVEAVAGIVNRAELQAAAGVLLATLAFLRGIRPRGSPRWYGLSLAAFAFALLSKEHAIVWPALLGVVWLYRWKAARAEPNREIAPGRPPVWFAVVLVCGLAGYFWARAIVLPSVLGGDIPARDNPLVDFGVGARLLTAAKVYYGYLRLLVAPLALSCDYSAHAIGVATSLRDADAFAGAALMAVSVGLFVQALRMTGRSREARKLAAGMGLFVVTYGLISNVALLSTILMAERLMYLPSMGWCVVGGVIISLPWRTSARTSVRLVVCALAVLTFSGYAVRSWSRAAEWRDPVTLFRSSVEAYGGSIRARYNLAHALLERGAIDEADAHLRDAQALAPGDWDILNLLGNVRFERADYRAALDHFRAALEARPDPVVVVNLCRALVAVERHAEAISRCSAATDLRPGDAMPHLFLGIALREQGQPAAAMRSLERARRLEPDNPQTAFEIRQTRGP